MRRTLLFVAGMILCCTLLERQCFTLDSLASGRLLGSISIKNTVSKVPGNTVSEPLVLSDSSGTCSMARLFMHRDAFVYRPEIGSGNSPALPAAIITQAADIKYFNLVPFNLRI